MATTQTVQLEPGLIAIIAEGFRPKCEHDSCHEQARHGHRDEDRGACPVDNSYVHVIAGTESSGGGIYLDGAFTATMTADAADEFIAALNARVRHIRNMGAAKITPAPERGPLT